VYSSTRRRTSKPYLHGVTGIVSVSIKVQGVEPQPGAAAPTIHGTCATPRLLAVSTQTVSISAQADAVRAGRTEPGTQPATTSSTKTGSVAIEIQTAMCKTRITPPYTQTVNATGQLTED
jgi:hypothetical protein